MPDPKPQGASEAEELMDDDSGRIPPPVSNGGPPSRSAAETFEEDTRNQLNLLRERTFNEELRQLVDRVRINEPSAEAYDGDDEDIDDLTEDELNLRLYRLYYRARMLHDNREMNVAFNPFEMPDAAGSSIDGALNVYIQDRMARLNLSHFAIMSYNISEKGLVPSFQNLERYYVENLVIGLHDRLFKDIIESPDGVILDANDIQEDHFLEKIFNLKEGEEPRALFFVLLSYLVSDVVQELQGTDGTQVVPFLPSSILMIELPLQTSPYNKSAVFGTLRRKLALPFYLVADNRPLVFTARNYENIDFSYHVLDYLFTIFLQNPNRIGISIKVKSKESTSRTFIMKYIISQLGYKLRADSVLVHIIKGHIIILTKEEFLEIINSLIVEYNKLFNDQFSVVEFRPSEFEDSLEIIQKIVLV